MLFAKTYAWLYPAWRNCVATASGCVFRCAASVAHFFIFMGVFMKRDFMYIRPVDSLGRVCLPIEMRRAYDMENGTQVVITPTEDGIFLRCIADAKEQARGSLLVEIEEREKK